MKRDEVLRELEKAGTAQNRKVYARHGAHEPIYGVSYANLYKLQKKIGQDQQLADQLWKTGNHDACVLAGLIAEPAEMTATQLDAWAKQASNKMKMDVVAGVAAKHPTACQRAEKWIASKSEWLQAAGWSVLSALAGQPDAGGLDDEAFTEKLDEIERRIDEAPNYARYTMNGAVISIGIRNEALRRKAVAAARRIGRVEVDHGETGCKTPDAVAYIAKTIAHRKKKTAGRKEAPKSGRAKAKA